MNLIHKTIDLDADKAYVLERHCRINYECDSPWKRSMSYDAYRDEWFGMKNQAFFLNALSESMKDGGAIAEIITDENGARVAYLWVRFCPDGENGFRIADIQDIYVEDEFRGSGIACALMQYAETKARENGAKVIRSGTGCENIRSIGLHNKLGYNQYRYEYEKLL